MTDWRKIKVVLVVAIAVTTLAGDAVFGQDRPTASRRTAVIDGRNTPPRKPADRTIRYELARDGAEWKIDDIKGASDGEPWSIRGMLTASLKN